MIKPLSKQLDQHQNPIEIMGPCSDKSLNKGGNQPEKRWRVLTVINQCQNTSAFLAFWIPRLWKKARARPRQPRYKGAVMENIIAWIKSWFIEQPCYFDDNPD